MTKRFENTNTYLRAVNEGKVEEFHERYDAAVKAVRGRLGRTYSLIISGKDVEGAKTFTSTNPGNTKEVLGVFQKATKEQVDEAIRAAKKAFGHWGHTHFEKRAAIFERAADLLEERAYEFAAIMTLENGKNRMEAIADVDEAIDFLRYYAYELERNHGYERVMGEPYPGERTLSVLRPYGVFSVISPFNFPLAIACGMTTGALITGNTAVLKPASDTPWIAHELVKLLHEAGVPEDALHYVTGGGSEVGQAMLEHPDVSGVVFTGSREVGMHGLREFVGKRPRPYIAEMGGKNAVIVSKRSNLEGAIQGVARSAFGFGGEKCSAASRCYVERDVYDRFVEGLAEAAKAVKVSQAHERDNGYGPLINAAAVKTYEEAVALAKKDGKILAGGKVLKEGSLADGYFVAPTVVVDLPVGHDLEKRELFVPLIAVWPVASVTEGIARLNDVEYGLTGGIFTEDADEKQEFFDHAEVGVMYVNRTRGGSTGAMVGGQVFGGWKFSGTTGKGAGGTWYLPQFMREQSRTIAE